MGPIGRGEIHVWLAGIRVPAEVLARMADVLDEGERERAARFRFHDDRARSTVARAALRQLLGGYLGRDPRALRFTSGAQGKPALTGKELQFNVSHSGERVAIAIGPAGPVGIDIEHERDLHDAVMLAHRFFSPNEAAAVERDPSLFLPIWTAKESVIKAIGGGLSIDLASFEAFASPERFAPVTNLTGWHVRALPMPGAGYYGALCAQGDALEVSVREWSFPR
ncbi:MAG TPA: 4'-phosphopantetheinyl transferase superfamily protein [Thermoanaerobaculia bacterium]